MQQKMHGSAQFEITELSYLGIEVDDAFAMVEQTEVWSWDSCVDAFITARPLFISGQIAWFPPANVDPKLPRQD